VKPVPAQNHTNSILNERGWLALQIIMVTLAGAAAYSNSLHGQFVLDDFTSISFYGPKGFWEALRSGGLRRFANATFAINYSLHGMEVVGYHLVNLAIHISTALTAWYITISSLAALRCSYPGQLHPASPFVERFVPLAVALLFVLHPVQTQAVSYIIQRYTSLATLFYLLSALMFIRARLAIENKHRTRCTLAPAAATLVTAALAFGCKEITVTLPVTLVFLELFLFRGRLLTRRFFIACGLLILVGLAVAALQWQARSLHDFVAALDRATAENHFIPRSSYFLTQLFVVATYLRLLWLPFGQSLLYDYPVQSTLLSVPVMAALLLHLALICSAVLLLRKSRRPCPKEEAVSVQLQQLVALGIVWFYCTMAVESSIFPITDLIFEHRIYLPSFGFFLAVAAGTAWVAHTCANRIRIAWLLLSIVCLALGALTLSRNQIWSNTLTLWQDTVKKAPNEDLALANLAGEYMKLDKPETALPLFVKALELNPDFHPRTKIYLGMTLKQLGIDSTRYTTGEEFVQTGGDLNKGTVRAEDEKKMEGVLYNNLALSHEIMGNSEKALKGYRTALKANPAYGPAWYNAGMLFLKNGDRQQAETALLRLREIDPSSADKLNAAIRKRTTPP